MAKIHFGVTAYWFRDFLNIKYEVTYSDLRFSHISKISRAKRSEAHLTQTSLSNQASFWWSVQLIHMTNLNLMWNLHIGNLLPYHKIPGHVDSYWNYSILTDNSPNNHKCEHSFTLLIALTWFQSTCMEKKASICLYSPYSWCRPTQIFTNYTDIQQVYF